MRLIVTVLIFMAFMASCTNAFFGMSPKSSGTTRLADKTSDIISIKGSVLSKIVQKVKPFLPVIGFYVFMNLPIYGVGIASSPGTSQGFGSMTDFKTITNRGTPSQISKWFDLQGLAQLYLYCVAVNAYVYLMSVFPRS